MASEELAPCEVALRYAAMYRDGYFVVVDTTTGAVVPPAAGHYKAHRDGYLWYDAAVSEAHRLNEEARAR